MQQQPPMPPLPDQPQPQMIPVTVYATEERLTIAAPMPGMEPEDIVVTVTPNGMVVLEGRLRGMLKGVKTLLANEWNAGPYFRMLPLPCPVDGTLANVTYGNGVLVVMLPVAQQHRACRLTLDEISPTKGERANSSGTPVRASQPRKRPARKSA